jgi:thiamine monophosphate synthase
MAERGQSRSPFAYRLAEDPAGYEIAQADSDALSAAVEATDRPVLAIGGITPTRATACFHAGASGVAAISLFFPEGRAPGSIGIRRAANELRAAFGLSPLR